MLVRDLDRQRILRISIAFDARPFNDYNNIIITQTANIDLSVRDGTSLKELKMRMFLGIDGGGTKTLFLIADENGHVLATHQLSGVDFTQIGVAGVRRTINDGTQAILQKVGATRENLSAVCAGIPLLGEYADWDETCPRLFQDLFPDTPVRCVNDSVIALYGSLALQPGIHLVAGTGSIVFGRNAAGETARSGGWNEHMSDEGSAYWLGLRACSLFTRQADGRLPRGPLYHLFYQEFSLIHDMDFIAYFHDHLLGARDQIAAIQKILARAADAGDASARQAYSDAAEELAALVLAVRHRLFADPLESVPVACTGGVLKAGPIIVEPLKKRLESGRLVWTKPSLPPAAGAILGACEAAGFSPDKTKRIQHVLLDAPEFRT